MLNTEGTAVDLYIPRKCSWTNKLITAKDHASIQINVGHLDEEGVYSNNFTTYALRGRSVCLMSGSLPQLVKDALLQGEADSSLEIMWKESQKQGAK